MDSDLWQKRAWPVWTFVSLDAFRADGKVLSFEMYVTGYDKALRVGIYRLEGIDRGQREFKLVQSMEWPNGFSEGYHQVGTIKLLIS